MTSADDFNNQIIAEFRAGGGELRGAFAGGQYLLLHHRGRRTGTERVTPLAYLEVDGGWAVFASFAGAPRHPDWYFNLLAQPHATVEVGPDTVEVMAREATGAERDEVYERQKASVPVFSEYEAKAAPRVIPVVLLEPTA